MRSVLIAGAGLAGARCAETLRALGFDGRVVLVGNERIPPYERPALSKDFLLGKRSTEDLLLRPRSFWAAQSIELVLADGIVAARDGTATTASGATFSYDALVVATGARPRRLGDAPMDVHVLRSLADAEVLANALRRSRRLAIIGGGFVGAEVASSARALGVDVVVIEAAEAPFGPLLGPDVADVLLRRYRACGVDVRTGVSVRRFVTDAGGHIAGTALTDGSDVECDVALAAVGVEPARELADAASPRIHVCGDAAGGGHWTGAALDGAGAAHELLGLRRPALPPPYFWSDQFDLRIQLVGTTRGAATVDLDGHDDAFVARYRGRDGAMLGALAVNRPAQIASLRRQLALAA
jgi:NADPH-dependent 2,4-dienoyl-CoA reductase/sulfur reductase-like enzyme